MAVLYKHIALCFDWSFFIGKRMAQGFIQEGGKGEKKDCLTPNSLVSCTVEGGKGGKKGLPYHTQFTCTAVEWEPFSEDSHTEYSKESAVWIIGMSTVPKAS